MVQRWDAARNERLFGLIIDNLQIDYRDISAKWAEKFPGDAFKPSASALSQHVNAMKKANKSGGGGGGSASKPKAAPTSAMSTPKSTSKRAAPKTPASSNKRARSTMSDEDDSEDQKEVEFTTKAQKRTTPSRRSASVRKSYADDGGEVADSDDEMPPSLRTERAAEAYDCFASGSPRTGDDILGELDNGNGSSGKPKARSKKDPQFKKSYFDHDILEESDFDPML